MAVAAMGKVRQKVEMATRSYVGDHIGLTYTVIKLASANRATAA